MERRETKGLISCTWPSWLCRPLQTNNLKSSSVLSRDLEPRRVIFLKFLFSFVLALAVTNKVNDFRVYRKIRGEI